MDYMLQWKKKKKAGRINKKARPVYTLPTTDPCQIKKHIKTKRKGIKIFHANGNNNKKSWGTKIYSDKIDCKMQVAK